MFLAVIFAGSIIVVVQTLRGSVNCGTLGRRNSKCRRSRRVSAHRSLQRQVPSFRISNFDAIPPWPDTSPFRGRTRQDRVGDKAHRLSSRLYWRAGSERSENSAPLRIPSKEGRGVGLCWAHSQPKSPENGSLIPRLQSSKEETHDCMSEILVP